MKRRRIVLTAALLACIGCSEERAPVPPEGATQADTAANVPLVPENATLQDVNKLVHDPRSAEVAALVGDTAAAQVRQGMLIVRQTREFAGRYVGNELSCANCHLNAGQKAGAIPFVGIAALFPQYRSRAGRLISLEDRIRGCFSRSMNGTAPPMIALSYLRFRLTLPGCRGDSLLGPSPPGAAGTVLNRPI